MNYKKHKNKLLLTAAAVTVIGAGILGGTAQVSAQTTPTEDRPMSALAQKIADKFGLEKAEVQAVFDESRAEMEVKFKADYEARLNQLVTDGKITEAQRQLIINKHNELKANRQAKMENLKNMTDEQRKAAMEAERQALQNWAEENNIDIHYLMFAHAKGPSKHGLLGERTHFFVTAP
jgi:hypothetical protein